MNENQRKCWIAVRDAINEMLIVEDPDYQPLDKRVEQQQITAQPIPAKAKRVDPLADVTARFPPDLQQLLTFADKPDCIVVAGREYLTSDVFRRVSSIVKNQLDGDYVSAGRDSHFRVPKRRQA